MILEVRRIAESKAKPSVNGGGEKGIGTIYAH
jgi:hypothetical protein